MKTAANVANQPIAGLKFAFGYEVEVEVENDIRSDHVASVAKGKRTRVGRLCL